MINRKRPGSLQSRPSAQPESTARPDPEASQAALPGQVDRAAIGPVAKPAPATLRSPDRAAAPGARPTGHAGRSPYERIAWFLESMYEQEFVDRATYRFCLPFIRFEEDVSALMDDPRLSADFRSALAYQVIFYKDRLEELEVELIEGLDVEAAGDGAPDGEDEEPPGGGRRQPTTAVPRGDASQPREGTTGPRSTGDRRRSQDRLRALYARAREGFEELDGEFDDLLEAGAMDGDPAAGLSASDWASRFAEVQWMAEDLRWRIHERDDGGAGRPPVPGGGGRGPASVESTPEPPRTHRRGASATNG